MNEIVEDTWFST